MLIGQNVLFDAPALDRRKYLTQFESCFVHPRQLFLTHGRSHFDLFTVGGKDMGPRISCSSPAELAWDDSFEACGKKKKPGRSMANAQAWSEGWGRDEITAGWPPG